MKRAIVGLASAGVLLFGIATNVSHTSRASNLDSPVNSQTAIAKTVTVQSVPKAKPVCDGTTITTACVVDNVNYSLYVYHAAVPARGMAALKSGTRQKYINTAVHSTNTVVDNPAQAAFYEKVVE